MDSVKLTASPRPGRGTQAAKRLRRSGLVPAIIYGHKEAAVAVALPLDLLEKAIRHGHRVIDLQLEKSVENALVQEIQWDHLGKDILHVDFKRVAKDEKVIVSVALELRGIAPGVTAGGVLDQPLHSLEVECLAISIPETIRVNINELQLGQAIHVRELTLPTGVTSKADADAIVVQVKTPEAEEGAGGPPTEQAEPELIGRQKPVEEVEEK